MTLDLTSWEDEAAWTVFVGLDLNDRLEAALWRGDNALPMALWADWRLASADPRAVLRIARWRGAPFALVGLQPTGVAGVMQAGLVAADHKRHRRALARLTRLIAGELPDRAAEWGVSRIEVRSWTHHPTAARLLTACGFRLETKLAGMPAPYAQYAWTLDHGEPPCA